MPKISSDQAYKSGFVALTGMTNVGKSTLFNALIGSPLAIITKKPQTTRYALEGIVTTAEFQIIYIDTPGYHDHQTMLGDYMIKETNRAIKEADLQVLISTPEDSAIEDLLLDNFTKHRRSIYLVINKIDQYPDNIIEQKIAKLKNKFSVCKVFKTSARQDKNLSKLNQEFATALKAGPQLYDPQALTTKKLRSLVAEFIREAAMHLCYYELPYRLAVEVLDYKSSKSLDVITAVIYVDKPGSQAILVGSRGETIKQIGKKARLRIEKFIKRKVFLQLSVKVWKNWHKNQAALKAVAN